MYCNQCGTKIDEAYEYCPKCGTRNIYCTKHKFQNKKISHDQTIFNNKPSERSNTAFSRKNIAIPIGIIAAICIVAVIAVFSAIPVLNTDSKSTSGVNYSPKTHFGYLGDVNGSIGVSFIDENGNTTAIRETKRAAATPDYSKYIFMDENDTLWRYISDNEKLKISDGVYDALAMNNDGVFYELKNESETDFSEVIYYEFDTETKYNIGMTKRQKNHISSSSTALAAINYNNELLVYSSGYKDVKNLGSVNSTAEICAVSDDGDQVIWSDHQNNEFLFYMASEGVSTYIGSLAANVPDPYINAVFFNNGENFVIIVDSQSQIIIGKSSEDIKNIDIGNDIYSWKYSDNYGRVIDSDDDTINSFYITTRSDTDKLKIYMVSLDGKSEYIADCDGTDHIYISNQNIYYYLNNNIYVSRRSNDGTWKSTAVAEEVDDFYVPVTHEIAYILKNNNLYYCDISGNINNPQLIASDYNSFPDFILTPESDTIYYSVPNGKYSASNVYQLRTLYKYTIGKEPQIISDNIVDILESEFTETNYFYRYVTENEDHGIICDLITFDNNGEKKILLNDLFLF